MSLDISVYSPRKMEFKEDLQRFIETLSKSDEYLKDVALRRVVELLRSLDSETELLKHKELINRLTIDSVESWRTINLISTFMKRHCG